MTETWQFFGPDFTAGAVFEDDVCVRAADKIGFMIGQYRQQCTGFARAAGWQYRIVPDYGSRLVVPPRYRVIAEEGSDPATG